MSLWRELCKGFTEGFITVVTHTQFSSGRQSSGRIEQLCRDLAWTVNERNGNVVHLHFGNPPGRVRKVCIVEGDEWLVTFCANTYLPVPSRNVPGEVLAYLLRRNLTGDSLGRWGMQNRGATAGSPGFHRNRYGDQVSPSSLPSTTISGRSVVITANRP